MTTHAKPTEHNRHKPPVPAPPILPTMPAVLNVAINQINLFGQTVDVQVPQGTASINNYVGYPLFIAGITLPTDASPVLVFDINDVGPPVNWPPANALTKAVPAKATLSCSWLGTAKYQTAKTPNPVNYTGGPIVIVGELGQEGDFDYVMVLSQGNVIEVRWLDNAPDALETPPTTAYVVKPPSGAGVAGPFGFGSP
jgi:hypothetical protein